MDGAQSDAEALLQHGGQHLHRVVVRVQLDLAGAVDEQVGVLLLLRQTRYPLLQPVEVLDQELHAVDEAAVGPEAEFVHDVLELDKLGDVDVRLVGKAVVGGVEVDDGDGTAEGAEELGHSVAVGGLAGAGGTDHQLAETNLANHRHLAFLQSVLRRICPTYFFMDLSLSFVAATTCSMISMVMFLKPRLTMTTDAGSSSATLPATI